MLEDKLLAELDGYLFNDDKLLGRIFRLKQEGVVTTSELLEKSTAANYGVLHHNLTVLKALRDHAIPTGSNVSRYAAQAAGRILRDNPTMSTDLKSYLLDLKEELISNSDSLRAVSVDQSKIDEQSEVLAEQAAHISDGIYVYSFPTYLHFGTIEDRDVFWLKIGSTKKSVWQRIVDQNRQTSMPEDPKLLRIYHKPNMDIDEVEKRIHSTLDRVGHERSAAKRTKSGTEWFATTLDGIDAIAELLELTIERYEKNESSL